MEGAVSMRNLVLGLVAGLLLAFTPVHAVRAQAQDFALAGQVSSAEEGPMEGVLVSAKKAGSTIAVTVVTGAQGRYSFPRARLEPGNYALRIRAVAEEARIPIVENPPLARALHANVELDQEIPPEHDNAGAEGMSYVMRLSGAVRWGRKSDSAPRYH